MVSAQEHVCHIIVGAILLDSAMAVVVCSIVPLPVNANAHYCLGKRFCTCTLHKQYQHCVGLLGHCSKRLLPCLFRCLRPHLHRVDMRFSLTLADIMPDSHMSVGTFTLQT